MAVWCSSTTAGQARFHFDAALARPLVALAASTLLLLESILTLFRGTAILVVYSFLYISSLLYSLDDIPLLLL